jgi:WD40 repeat protein
VGADRVGRIFDLVGGATALQLGGHTEEVTAAAFSPDGTRVATSGRDRTARVWDARTGELQLALVGHGSQVSPVVFSRDGERLLTASSDGTARLWSLLNGAVLAVFEGHSGPVRVTAFAPDGARVMTAGFDGTVRVWDATAVESRVFAGPGGSIRDANLDPAGRRLLIRAQKGGARLLDVERGTTLLELSGVAAAKLSPDGTVAAFAKRDGTVALYHTMDGALAGELLGHRGEVSDVAFSPDGTRVMTGGDDGTVRWWRVADGAEERRVAGAARVGVVRLGRMRAIAVTEAGSRIYDATTGALLGGFDLFPDPALSPDEALVATGDERGMVTLWDTATGHAVVRLRAHAGVVSVVRFSPDGRLVASGGEDGKVRVWTVASPGGGITLGGHNLQVYALAFDGQGFLASGSLDKTVRLWDVDNAREIPILRPHGGAVRMLRAVSGGLVSADDDGTVALWSRPAERRSQRDVDALLACRVPYAVVDGRLTERAPSACQ